MMFKEVIKELRKKMGKTQEDVANYLRISRVAYTNYERGIREPDFETAKKLAEYFSVSTDYLLGKTDDPTPPDAKKSEDRPIPEDYVLITANPKGGRLETHMIPYKDWETVMNTFNLLKTKQGRGKNN